VNSVDEINTGSNNVKSYIEECANKYDLKINNLVYGGVEEKVFFKFKVGNKWEKIVFAENDIADCAQDESVQSILKRRVEHIIKGLKRS